MPVICKQTQKKQVEKKGKIQSINKQKKQRGRKAAKISKKQLRTRTRHQFVRRKNISTRKHHTMTIQQVEQLTNIQLECPICLQTYLRPTVTPCGHIFCLPCIQQSLKHKDKCSLCRYGLDMQNLKPEKILLQLLQVKLKKQSDRQIVQNYYRRVEQFQLQENKRNITPQIKVGDFVDFWNQRKWKGGKVKEVLSDKRGNKVIKVEPQRSYRVNEVYQFSLTSRLIKKHRTFSKYQPPLHHYFDVDQQQSNEPAINLVPLHTQPNNLFEEIQALHMLDMDAYLDMWLDAPIIGLINEGVQAPEEVGGEDSQSLIYQLNSQAEPNPEG